MINLTATIPQIKEELDYLECPITIEHALVHAVSAIESLPDDMDQLEHDLNLTHSIIKVLADEKAKAELLAVPSELKRTKNNAS